MFDKVLIANRGEIALRVIRACRELGMKAVAVYSDADANALHVREADEAYRLGPAPAPESYLNVERIFEIARTAKCDALHPGYGFLAESAEFADACVGNHLTFIGPSGRAIRAMGGKIAARAAARSANVSIVPGTTDAVRTLDEARAAAARIGYPVAVKAAAGGGGKGLKIAHSERDLDGAFELAGGEAAAYFKDATLYLERYLARPKHVEVQILGDQHGNVVHLGERDCSLQRRHQKLVEETPAQIPAQLRVDILDAGVRLARAIAYDSAGTLEFLVDGDSFFFLEMNARIQVEHTITEMTWGVDLVKAQIRIAAGEPLWVAQSDLSSRGHAIEARINAESPPDFAPCAGTIERFAPASGPGVRVDTAAFDGATIPQEYDSLIAKLCVWGTDRAEARARMLRALGEFEVRGVDTTIAFLKLLLADHEFAGGAHTTGSVEEFLRREAARIAQAYPREDVTQNGEPVPDVLTVEVEGKRFTVRVYGPPFSRDRAAAPRRPRAFKPRRPVARDGGVVESPMHGIVTQVRVQPGEAVHDGQVVAVIEAMKMMNEVVAHRNGTVKSIEVKIGETVEAGSTIVALSHEKEL